MPATHPIANLTTHAGATTAYIGVRTAHTEGTTSHKEDAASHIEVVTVQMEVATALVAPVHPIRRMWQPPIARDTAHTWDEISPIEAAISETEDSLAYIVVVTTCIVPA